MKRNQTRWIRPDWPAPQCIHAFTTTRLGGVSQAPFDSFNLAQHVGDDPRSVAANRDLLRGELVLPSEPVWLNQVHGDRLVDAACVDPSRPIDADGAFCGQPGVVCTVMTADCLPVLLARSDGSGIAAVHAGWRGLAAGIVQRAVETLPGAGPVLAWLGPAIGPACFEVGLEVKQAFAHLGRSHELAFRRHHHDKYHADIYALARMALLQCGVTRLFGGRWCTHRQSELFYSYRRSGETGRMASLIWMASRT